MPRLEKQLESWAVDAIDLMARTGISLEEAAGQLGQNITSDECATIARRKSFNRLLWETRHRYFNQLATDPNFKKESIIGKLISLAQKLEDRGDYDKAAEAVLKAAKVAGFVGVEGQVNVFGDLSQADFDKIRENLTKAKATPSRLN